MASIVAIMAVMVSVMLLVPPVGHRRHHQAAPVGGNPGTRVESGTTTLSVKPTFGNPSSDT